MNSHPNTSAFLQNLWQEAVHYKRRIAFGLSATILVSITETISPLLLKIGIDGLHTGKNLAFLYLCTGAIIFSAAVGGVFRFYMRDVIIGVSRWVESDIREKFFNHILKLPPAFFDRHHTGDIMARATDDLERIRMVMGPGLLYTVNTQLTIVFSIVLMFILNVQLALVVMLLAPLVAATMLAIARALHKAYILQQETYGQLTTQVQENLAGIRVIKGYVREDYETEKFGAVCRRYFRRSMVVARLQALMFPAIGFLIGMGIAGILYIGGQQVALDKISLGSFIAFMSYLSMMTWPMIALGWVVHLYQRGAASHKRLMYIFDQKAQFEDVSETLDVERETQPLNTHIVNSSQFAPSLHREASGNVSASADCIGPTAESIGRPLEVEFDNIRFRYRGDGESVLDDFKLILPSGKITALVGATGSGKSTVARLLVRLYEPQAGCIRIDGIQWNKIPIAGLRQIIGYVDQTPFLFSATIRENLLFSNSKAGESDISEAIKTAAFDRDMEDFPERLDTLLGERGITLSGGQQQRLTIARALISRSPILILDDALSAVDADTEKEILDRLTSAASNRTVLFITHRLAAAECADGIAVLQNGRIVESGSHNELLAIEGLYARMSRRQRLAREIEVI